MYTLVCSVRCAVQCVVQCAVWSAPWGLLSTVLVWPHPEVTGSRTEHEIAGAAGQMVPTQLAEKIVIFAAELLGHHPDTALCPGWSHMRLYEML